jgi:REP element-mobilizing transposase RayT
MSSPRFYDPAVATKVYGNHPPHWDQVGATFFLTFRLADAVPADALRAYVQERREWLLGHPEPPWPPEFEKEYHRKFTGRFERWLDRGFGSCILRKPECARIVADALRHFEGERCTLHAWVVMPNHVHAVASLVGDETLAGLLQSWKGYTSRQINQYLGTTGSVWQKSYFDRIVRDWDHFAACARYIRNNPVKANLSEGCFLHGESDLTRRILG